MSKKKIIGIDPGTRITGYGVIEVDGSISRPLDFGCIRPPVTLAPPQKYLFLFKGVKKLLDRYTPDAVAIETQFAGKNFMSVMKLGMARAAILIAAALAEIPIFEYTPRKAKLAVVGNGGASKAQVQKMVQILLHLPSPPEPEDAADALALAICHAHASERLYQGLSCLNISKEY